MIFFLELAFLFMVGSMTGWIIEVLYRKFISSANPDRKWINPGFLTGPYLPLYGFSLCALFLLAHIKTDFIENKLASKIILFIFMSLIVTFIEYIAGLVFVKRMKIKLWDYENEWGNIKGIICPKYSFFWAVLSAIYYFFIHPNMMKSLHWLSENLTFSFVMGFFYGIFALDFWYTMNIMAHIKKFAEDNEIIVKYEMLKETIRIKNEEFKEKRKFLFVFSSEHFTFTENLMYYLEREQARIEKIKEKYETVKDNIMEEYEIMKCNIKEEYENVKDNIKEEYENVRDNIKGEYENVRDNIKENFKGKKG